MQFEALGSYEILQEWGRSPAGRSLIARHRESGRDVAIELFETLYGLPADDRSEASERVLRSCRPLVGLAHPNIVCVLDVGLTEGIPFVVTEHVGGTPFDLYCRPGSLLDGPRLAEQLAAAATGLQAAHGAGVVHGDLRPDRLLRIDSVVKVCGFGRGAALPTDLQRSHYQSPEQVRREELDGRSDVFSLGAVMYEMLSGRQAFEGESSSTVLYRVVNEDARDPRELNTAVHEVLAQIVMRAVAKRRRDRFESIGEMGLALQEASVTLGVDARIESDMPPDVATASAAPSPPPAALGQAVPNKKTTGLRPFLLGTLLVAFLVVAGLSLLREGDEGPGPVEQWLEARVRTEPPGVLLSLDGEPVTPGEDGKVRFRGSQPFGVLQASYECRQTERTLQPADAGTEVVLVMDPVETDVDVDPSVDGARVSLNGDPAGSTPASLTLDLCRDNRLELQAAGYHPAAVDIPAGATPLDARKLAFSLALEVIPRGRLTLPRKRGLQLVYYVDGKRIGKSVREIELEEGEHRLRYKNEFHWLDETMKVQITAGETSSPAVAPGFGTLVVQAFPSNCKVYLRQPGGTWRYLDDTPAERRVVTGPYEVKVQLIPTGESRVETIRLREGANPPVRVAFGGDG